MSHWWKPVGRFSLKGISEQTIKRRAILSTVSLLFLWISFTGISLFVTLIKRELGYARFEFHVGFNYLKRMETRRKNGIKRERISWQLDVRLTETDSQETKCPLDNMNPTSVKSEISKEKLRTVVCIIQSIPASRECSKSSIFKQTLRWCSNLLTRFCVKVVNVCQHLGQHPTKALENSRHRL